MRIRINYYSFPDPGSGNSPYGSKKKIFNLYFFSKKIQLKKKQFHIFSALKQKYTSTGIHRFCEKKMYFSCSIQYGVFAYTVLGT